MNKVRIAYLVSLVSMFCVVSVFNYSEASYYDADHFGALSPIPQYIACLDRKVNPQSTVLAFDLHEVVFNRLKMEIMMHVLTLMPRGMWWYACNYYFLKDIYRLRSEVVIEEAIFKKLIEQYPDLERFKQDFFDIANTVTPIEPMVEFIRYLKQQGYHLYVLSNIGEDTYKQLSEKYPDIVECFDGAYVPCDGNNYNHKPKKQFYQEFKDYLAREGHQDKQVLFIDDLEKNLRGALDCAIAGIHCTQTQYVKDVFTLLETLDKALL
jgi:FMN phosphatase YigB (HAD superfamily)